MYVFKENVEKNEYINFYKQYSKAPIMQEYIWPLLKSNWDSNICGLYKENKLIATALILIKKLPFNISIFYIPRGYLLDFTNKEVLNEFTKHIKAYAKKKKSYLIKIDPYISFNEKRVNPLDENEHYNFYSDNVELIFNNLKELGYVHKGYKKEIRSYLQPRFAMIVPLVKADGTFFTEESFSKTLKRNVRYYLGDYHSKRGVIFNYSNNIDDLDEFINLIHKTEDRQNVLLRNKNYFKKMMELFGDRALLFFGKIDLNKYLEFIESSYNDNNSEKDLLNKQKEQVLELKKTKGDIITVSASLMVLPSNEKGIRMAEFLYEGNDTSILPNLKVNNGAIYYKLMHCLNNNCHYANLGGIDGSLNDHLFTFKSKFNPLVVEFIGELDLPINKFLYIIINVIEPVAKKVYRKVRINKK